MTEERIEPIHESEREDTGRWTAHLIYRFDNGYGASVLIDDKCAELMAIRFDGEGAFDWEIWRACPLAPEGFGGIIGYSMTDDEVQEALRKMRSMS